MLRPCGLRRTGMEEFLRGGLPELRIYGRAERKLLRAPDVIGRSRAFLPSAAAAMTTGRTTVSTFPMNALLVSITAARAGG